MNPDVIGINEIENDGYGPTSAIQFLVDKLNQATVPGTFAFIDVDTNTAQVNAMGADAIKVGLLYKPAKVTPVGRTAALNSIAFVNGGEFGPRNRPSVAQAFQENATGARFIVDVNHLKSKGTGCTAPDAGDGQGLCNEVRVNAANALTAWLATDPTGTADPDILLIGDYNSYAKEESDHRDQERRLHEPDRVARRPGRVLVCLRRPVGLPRPRTWLGVARRAGNRSR